MDELKAKPKRSKSTIEARTIFIKLFEKIGYGEIDYFGNKYHANHDYTAELRYLRGVNCKYTMSILEDTSNQSHVVFGFSSDNKKGNLFWSTLARFYIIRSKDSDIFSYYFDHIELNNKKDNETGLLDRIEVFSKILSEIRIILKEKLL